MKTIDGALNFVENADQLREKAVMLSPILDKILKQVAECALFICDYVGHNHNFTGKCTALPSKFMPNNQTREDGGTALVRCRQED